ncbi:hypothetical protein YC2023_004534 [Brassica napus]
MEEFNLMKPTSRRLYKSDNSPQARDGLLQGLETRVRRLELGSYKTSCNDTFFLANHLIIRLFKPIILLFSLNILKSLLSNHKHSRFTSLSIVPWYSKRAYTKIP